MSARCTRRFPPRPRLTGSSVRADAAGWSEGKKRTLCPIWSCRHNWLYYRVGDEERRFKIRTLITWGTTWYITHLAEFRH